MEKGKLIARIVSWLFYSVLGAGIFTTRWLISGLGNTLYNAYDACFLAGIIVVLIGALTLVAYFGAFDMVAYGFTTLFQHMRPSKDTMHSDYAEYVEARQLRRGQSKPYFWPYTIIGGLFLIASLIFYLVVRG